MHTAFSRLAGICRSFLFARIVIGALALAFSAACSAQSLAPDYFAVTYEWIAGSVPPRYHYQYRVRIRTDGESEIVMVPGYPHIYDELPRWRAKFSPTREQLSALRGFAEKNDLFNPDALRPAPKKNEPVPVDPPGSTRCVLVLSKLNGTAVFSAHVPCNSDRRLADAGDARSDAFIKMVMDLVPKQDWESLKSLQARYARESSF